jgi:anti-sigma factor RsiW
MLVAQPITEADLQAYVDGRLTDARRAEVESWLARRSDEAARLAAYKELSERCRAVYTDVIAEPIPARIEQAWPHASHGRRRRAAVIALAVLIGVVGGAAGVGWMAELTLGSAASAMVSQAASAHRVYAPEVNHPVEARGVQKDELLAWLSARLAMPVSAPDLAASGLSFLGARLLPGKAGPAALLMYEGPAGQRVTLHWAPDYRSRDDTGLRYAQAPGNVRVFYWIDEECGYVVASADYAENELRSIAAAMHSQIEH